MFSIALPLLMLALEPQTNGTRLKELVSIEGVRENQLIGYGLVVGLRGTGDRQQTLFSAQSLANLLQQMGVATNPAILRVANTAAVMVTATLPPFAQPGVHIDVTASSIGDAPNLQGGQLLLTSFTLNPAGAVSLSVHPTKVPGALASAQLNDVTTGWIGAAGSFAQPAAASNASPAVRVVKPRMVYRLVRELNIRCCVTLPGAEARRMPALIVEKFDKFQSYNQL